MYNIMTSYDIRDDDLQSDNPHIGLSISPEVVLDEVYQAGDEMEEMPFVSEPPFLSQPFLSQPFLSQPFLSQPFLSQMNNTLSNFRRPIVKTDSLVFKDVDLSGNRFIEYDQQTRAKLENMFVINNSPISSSYNSDTEDGASGVGLLGPNDSFRLVDEEVENAFRHTSGLNYRKITFEEIERSLSKYYDKNNKYSNQVDILISFMRGQKHLYRQSNYITQMKLYAITITALSLTSFITVITPFIRESYWSIAVISGGNAIATVLITILNYLRFESACNTYTFLANHYEQYEHTLELTNNKLMFMENEGEQNKIVLEKIREVEFKMGETRELCPIVIPEEVKRAFPVIANTNIFSLIKKMDMQRKLLVIKFKDIKNEIRYILHKWETNPSSSTQKIHEKTRLLYLMEMKDKIKTELIEFKDGYSQIDSLFSREIKYAINRGFGCFKKQIDYTAFDNLVIREHLDMILV